ncbi:hypothetical protein BC351_03990 [Paenibacillus ferrarius]|uniref:Uncharacterized protein n=1 Tax=Paenibacillus ferrarius TaxID=1469647 RepID=A0A1V4HLX3_9BACL|nr:hypothetical protein [Paenibacillus ferrarius]OPH57684.1 hypothetical protein BC351_03990 [Paenibacillus ferrarius]
MNIKKWVIVSTSTILGLTLIVVVNNSFASSNPSVNKYELISTSTHDKEKIKEVGMTFKDDITIKPKQGASQAVASAKEYAPGYAEEAKKIEVEYHLVTNPNFNLFSKEAKSSNSKLEKDGFLLDTPCYVVTFKGISKPAKSYKNDQTPKTFTEYSVVVDANTNQVLYGFSYR